MASLMAVMPLSTLLGGSGGDCCDACFDRGVDPQRDRVVVNLPNLVQSHRVSLLKPSPSGKEAGSDWKEARIGVSEADGKSSTKAVLNVTDVELRWRPLPLDVEEPESEEAVRELQRRKQAEVRELQEAKEILRRQAEARELKELQHLADSIEAQAAAEEELALEEAKQASLREQEAQRRLLETELARRSEEAARLREEIKREELAERIKVERFLKSNGFLTIDSKRTRLLHTCYPLHVAVAQNNAEVVQLLLAAGARPLPRDSSGRTPLQLARHLNRKGSRDHIVKLLLFGSS